MQGVGAEWRIGEAAEVGKPRKPLKCEIVKTHIFCFSPNGVNTVGIQSSWKVERFELNPQSSEIRKRDQVNDEQHIQDLRSCTDGFLNVFHYPALSLKPELLSEHSSYLLPDKQMLRQPHWEIEFSRTQLDSELCAVTLPKPVWWRLIIFITVDEWQITQLLQGSCNQLPHFSLKLCHHICVFPDPFSPHLAPCLSVLTGFKVCVMSWNDRSCWAEPHWEQPNDSVEGESPNLNNARLISASNSLHWTSSVQKRKISSCILLEEYKGVCVHLFRWVCTRVTQC